MKDNTQQGVNLTTTDLNKLKVFCDYLFYDQIKSNASYSRFIECCGFVLEQLKEIEPLKLFKNLCGYNCKYLTVSRLLKQYQQFKEKIPKVPFHIKTFFTVFFNSCLNINKDHKAGRELNEMTYLTDFSTNHRLSNLILYRNAEDILQGFTIEYNNNIECHLYDIYSTEDKYVCFNLPLDYLKEIKVFDGITHCFGYFTDKIEFIGFKCRSGIMKSFGIQKGEPFLFGEYGKIINGLKIQMNSKGITFLQPSFSDCGITNYYIDQIGKNVLEDKHIFEERLFNDETPIEDAIIYSPIVNDYNEINLKYDCFIFKKVLDGNKITYNQEDLIKIEDDISIRVSRRRDKSISINTESNGYCDRWKNQTIKSESVGSLLLNAAKYNSMINKLKFEIEREIEAEMLKYDYDKQFDFYDEYLMKYNILQPFPSTPKHYDNYKDIICIQYDFSSFNKGIEEEEDKLFELKHPSKLFTDVQIVSYWRKFYKKMTHKSKLSLFKSMMCLIKSIKIMETIEDQFIDETIPLEKKIIYYKELINSKRIIHYLSSSNQTHFPKNNPQQNYIDLSKEQDYIVDINDYPSINQKLIQIENLMKNNTNKEHYKQLSFLYRKYSKMRLELINQFNKEQISSSLKLIEEKYDCNSIRKEIKPEKKTVNRTEAILFTSGNIEIASLKSLNLSSVSIYQKQQICKTNEFKDTLFPPNLTSIGNSNLKNWNNIKWEKSDLILYSTAHEVFSPNKIDCTIQSGLVLNNSFQIALTALMKYPYLIKGLFPFWQKSDNGQYGVYMRIKGIWKLVLVDDIFPCLFNKENITCFAFSSLKKSHQIWVQLIEKAIAKVNHSYSNMLKNTVKDLFDVLTNSITEKIAISFELECIILNRIRQEIVSSILVAKATSSISFCREVGLIPGYYYIIEGIKNINIRGLPETLIKLSNNFGCLKYKGNWSKNSPKWIPSIIHERIDNDNEFYISLNDFLKYFSVLYINKVYHQSEDEQINYVFVHYSKNESLTPKVTKLKIMKPTQLDIQFHQYNSKYQLNSSLVPGFVMITDSNFEYINSISKVDYSFNMNLKLEKGEYYIYSDIFSRYLMKSNRGYTLSVYSQNEIELIKDSIVQPQFMLNQTLNFYMKDNIISLKEDFNIIVYQFNKITSQFPFIIQLYINKGPFEHRLELNVRKVYDKVKNYSFYTCQEYLNENNSQLNHILKPGESFLVIILRFNKENTIDLNYCIESSISSEKKEEYLIQNGEKEQLDEDGIVIQYVLRCKDGCYVLLKNYSEEEGFKMKLNLKGLTYDDYPKGDVVFLLERQSSKLFRLREIENNNSGINSFMFQLA